MSMGKLSGGVGEIPIPSKYSLELTIAERIYVLNLLPQEGEALQMRRVEQLTKRLLPSEEEEAAWGVTNVNGAFTWSPEAKTEAVVEIGQSMWDKLVSILTDRDKAGKLQLAHLGIYEKFVGIPPDAEE